MLAGIISISLCGFFTRDENTISIIAVICVIISTFVTNTYILPIYLSETYESSLKSNDVTYVLIEKKFPKEFKSYISRMKYSILKNHRSSEQFYYQITFINDIFGECIVNATSDSIYNYYKAELNLDKMLFKFDPKLVLFMEFSHKFHHKPNPYLVETLAGESLFNNALIAKKNVISSAIQYPQIPLNNEQREIALLLINKIMIDIRKKYGTEILVNASYYPDDPELDKKLAAIAIMSLYEEILESGKDNVALIIKYMANKSQH
jgi:hypothetical protein